ncbi:hypothetical protein QJS04_geneDACA008404 [Acorus gramineus]|uniref:2-carboxy-D-arabinitol-1-phosphatase n=1 Tax=Acorus gramineus TaxID=55184 RepID=A0AAV9AGS9_ACOGR|nr:hypothetical protein QJS04_geneDACA008404 [Acorus gramineus]
MVVIATYLCGHDVVHVSISSFPGKTNRSHRKAVIFTAKSETPDKEKMLALASSPSSSPVTRLGIRASSGLTVRRRPPPSDEVGVDGGRLAFPEIGAAKRVVLVRHGQSTWNEEGRIQGSSDHSVLTTKGEAQAETSRQMLLSDTFDICFTSPLIRSKRTAEIIWDARMEEMIPESDLREIDLYSFQGLLKHEGKARYGDAFQQWQIDAPNFNIDGHYPVRELWARAKSCWDKILAHDGKSVLVVAHNAVNQALVATAMGLGTEYFRILLQSNCGVSVLDFTPTPEGGSPKICLNRLNQTPNSPIAAGASAGRKARNRIILVCHGTTQSNDEAYGTEVKAIKTDAHYPNGSTKNFTVSFASAVDKPMNMLGIIQSQKTAELLLDLKVNSIICTPSIASIDTSMTISKIQEAADCLGADCIPRYVEVKKMEAFAFDTVKEIWDEGVKAWDTLLQELADESEAGKNVVVVGHPEIHTALIVRCLNLTKEWLGSFHLDAGSISVIDFPDGPDGRGVIRCVNYTAHLGRWSIPITRSTPDDEEF